MVPAPGELFVWDDSTTIRIISIRIRKEEERRYVCTTMSKDK